MDHCKECNKSFASKFSKDRHDEKFHTNEYSDTSSEEDEEEENDSETEENDKESDTDDAWKTVILSTIKQYGTQN